MRVRLAATPVGCRRTYSPRLCCRGGLHIRPDTVLVRWRPCASSTCPRAAIKAAPTAATEARRNKWPHEATASSTRGRCAARTRDARPYGGDGNICAQKLPCATSTSCSGAVGAAFEEGSVAVTAIRFHWPARSREGGSSMGRDSLVDSNSLRNAASGDTRRGAPRGTGGRSPRRILGTFLR